MMIAPTRLRPIAITGAIIILTCFIFVLGAGQNGHPASRRFSWDDPRSYATQPDDPSHPIYNDKIPVEAATADDDNPAAHRTSNRVYGPDYTGHSSADINRVANASLGFTNIFVVGLPERSDKRDAVALTAALTGFRVEWVDGVRGESIPDKAVPFGVDRKKLMETNLGSWRGHMDAVRRIVEQGLESALIMEDDMDWDVRLKPQLELIAAAARTVMSDLPDQLFPPGHPRHSRPKPTPDEDDYQADTNHMNNGGSPEDQQDLPAKRVHHPASPYGDDWDLLWLGHCGEPFPELLDENKHLPAAHPARIAMQQRVTLAHDATVPPLDHLTGLVNFSAYPAHSRFIHITAAPICSFAYALSQRGARRLLYSLAVDGLHGAYDNALAGLCRRAVSTWPDLLAPTSSSLSSAPTEQETWEEQHDSNNQAKRDVETKKMKTKKPWPSGDRGFDMKCLSVTPPVFFHHKAKGPISGDSDIHAVGGVGADGAALPMRDKGSSENIVWSARLNNRNMLLGEEMQGQWDDEGEGK